ncbi:MAG TPA: hypothetical protein VMW38_00850, partial [Terriglobia bacterium]|nr:hypothetical protein [Terriglobia bacterium]
RDGGLPISPPKYTNQLTHNLIACYDFHNRATYAILGHAHSGWLLEPADIHSSLGNNVANLG